MRSELNHTSLKPYKSVAIGISSGLRGEAHDEPAKWLPAMLEEFTNYPLEVSVMRGSELVGLVEYLKAKQKGLALPSNLSLHAPAKSLYLPLHERIEHLVNMPAEFKKIIAHPDVMQDPKEWARLGDRLVIENMDSRKSLGNSIDDLQRYFNLLPKASFCLDVAHIWTLDKSMQLGHDLLNVFGDRLVEVHFSGIAPHGPHCPLTAEQFEFYRPILDTVQHVPWILESGWAE